MRKSFVIGRILDGITGGATRSEQTWCGPCLPGPGEMRGVGVREACSTETGNRPHQPLGDEGGPRQAGWPAMGSSHRTGLKDLRLTTEGRRRAGEGFYGRCLGRHGWLSPRPQRRSGLIVPISSFIISSKFLLIYISRHIIAENQQPIP